MPWIQSYIPVAGSLGMSALIAAVPLAVIFVCLAIFKMKAHKAGPLAVASAVAIAVLCWQMPVKLAGLATLHGVAFGVIGIPVVALRGRHRDPDCRHPLRPYLRGGDCGLLPCVRGNPLRHALPGHNRRLRGRPRLRHERLGDDHQHGHRLHQDRLWASSWHSRPMSSPG